MLAMWVTAQPTTHDSEHFMSHDANDNSISLSDSLATPRAFEDDDAAAAAPCLCKTFSEIAEGCSLKALAILSLGL